MYDTTYIYVSEIGTSSQKSYTYDQIFLKSQNAAWRGKSLFHPDEIGMGSV